MQIDDIKKSFTLLRSVVKEMYTRFRDHGIGYSAGQIAYFFILSIFPFIIFVNALIASLNIPGEAAISFLRPFFPEQLVAFVSRYLEYINSRSGVSLLSFGIILALFSSSKSIRSLIRAFDLAYGKKHKRSFLSEIIFSMLFIILSAIIFIFCAVVVALGNDFVARLVADMTLEFAFIDIFALWRWATMALIMFVTLLLLYKLLPAAKVKLSEALPGCIFALCAFLIFTAAFSVYVNHIASASIFYGTVGAILLFMLWMYFTGIILLLGAELNKIILDIKSH